MTRRNFHDGRGRVEARRHINPDGSKGGWVAMSALVGPSYWVGRMAMIGGRGMVSESMLRAASFNGYVEDEYSVIEVVDTEEDAKQLLATIVSKQNNQVKDASAAVTALARAVAVEVAMEGTVETMRSIKEKP